MTSDVIPKYIQKLHFRLQIYYDAADNSIWKNVGIYVTILFSSGIWCILIYKNMHHSCSLTFDDLWSNYVSDRDISLFDLNSNICLLITKTTIQFWNEKIISSSLIMCKYLMLHLLKKRKETALLYDPTPSNQLSFDCTYCPNIWIKIW